MTIGTEDSGAQAGSSALPPGSSEAQAGLIGGRYRIEAALGQGGMATVWRVHDEGTGKKLALKRLSKTASPKILTLFEREFRTLASLRHPSIVEAYEYGSDVDGPYYTMELLAGSDVSLLSPKPWPLVCKIVRDVASGIALLHARRLIHRDLSARNVWLTPEGKIKLLDFGTMGDFGKAEEIVGTAPFIPPEALYKRELDQRSDLYALGALAYFLLTGRHAFPARHMTNLESVWKERPRPAGRRVAELGRKDLPDVPPALDALIGSLLSEDVLARPTTAADLIDRLTVIASLERERPVRVLESYLSAPTFVGRARERALLRSAAESAAAGSAMTVTVESVAGLGRSRLLDELVLEERLAGAIVLHAEPHADRRTHEVAQELSFQLLAALPAPARAAAKPYAATLGHLSSTLRKRLGIRAGDLAAVPHTHGEARMRVQIALRDWFLAVAREHRLVIIADDLEGFDDGSAAWLASLSREATAHKLLIAASLRVDGAPFTPPINALRQGATHVVLEPLSHEETFELFHSVFGEAPYLARLVDRIYQRAEGNPGHAIDLAELLSQNGVIAYADGAWLLPLNVDEVELPATRRNVEIARLAHLPERAHRVGQALAICEGVMTVAVCTALAGVEGAALFDSLETLVRAGVLAGSADGYRFSRESLRLELLAELGAEQERQAHRRLGQLLLAAPGLSQLERLKAGVHLLRGGDDEAGSRAVALASQHYGLVDLADLGLAAPSLAVALEHFKTARRSPYEVVSVLAPLALAGYYADKRLARRYGTEAVELLQRLLGLSLAQRLRPFLGRKLGLLLALLWSALGFAVRSKNPRVPKFKQAMMMMFNCAAALTGASSVCLDVVAAQRYAKMLEPMTALGPNHVATFMYDFCQNALGTIQNHAAYSRSRWMHMLERLAAPRAVRDLGGVHVLYLAGALYARGVGECRRDESAALWCADQLERLGLKLYDMSADQVRMIYHANRGNLEDFERYSKKVEVHAIQRGTAWQVEMWMYSSLMYIHLRTGDVAGLKDCAEQLKRLSADMPSLVSEHTRALASYLVLRGTPAEALRVMDENPEPPCEVIGWTRCQGVRARAHNDLGQHKEARETCLRALEYLTDDDLAFCGNNLGVSIELARAEAGLGEAVAAEARLRGLLERHAAGANPVTLGALHEALVEVFALQGDRASLLASLHEMERWFRPTRHPALVARCDRLRTTVHPVADGEDSSEEGEAQLQTVLHNLRHGGETTVSGSAEWALRQLAGLADLREAYLFLAGEGGAVSCAASIHAGEHTAALASWVQGQLETADSDIDTYVGDEDFSALDPTRIELGGTAYRLIFLHGSGRVERAVGALVVPRDAHIPHAIVREIAARLHISVSQQSAG